MAAEPVDAYDFLSGVDIFEHWDQDAWEKELKEKTKWAEKKETVESLINVSPICAYVRAVTFPRLRTVCVWHLSLFTSVE